MVLSDRSIREAVAEGRIVIEPLDDDDIQPASVDVHLADELLVFRNARRPYIDLRREMDDLTDMVKISDEDGFNLHPGEFVLASTREHIEIPDDLVARLEGKSSLGRVGLVIHSTAGYVDPGWKGAVDPGTDEHCPPADLPLSGDEDRPDIVSAVDDAGREAVRVEGPGQQVPGANGTHSQSVL